MTRPAAYLLAVKALSFVKSLAASFREWEHQDGHEGSRDEALVQFVLDVLADRREAGTAQVLEEIDRARASAVTP